MKPDLATWLRGQIYAIQTLSVTVRGTLVIYHCPEAAEEMKAAILACDRALQAIEAARKESEASNAK